MRDHHPIIRIDVSNGQKQAWPLVLNEESSFAIVDHFETKRIQWLFVPLSPKISDTERFDLQDVIRIGSDKNVPIVTTELNEGVPWDRIPFIEFNTTQCFTWSHQRIGLDVKGEINGCHSILAVWDTVFSAEDPSICVGSLGSWFNVIKNQLKKMDDYCILNYFNLLRSCPKWRGPCQTCESKDGKDGRDRKFLAEGKGEEKR